MPQISKKKKRDFKVCVICAIEIKSKMWFRLTAHSECGYGHKSVYMHMDCFDKANHAYNE